MIDVLGSDREKYQLSGTFDRLEKYFFKQFLEKIEISVFSLFLSQFSEKSAGPTKEIPSKRPADFLEKVGQDP